MYTKVIKFRGLHTPIVRGIYYLDREVPAHRDLLDARRWYLGNGVSCGYTLADKMWRYERTAYLRRGRRTKFRYFEAIVSSPKNADITGAEAEALALAVVDASHSVGAVVGAHWHPSGRCDVHILMANLSWTGMSLERATEMPVTLEPCRNLEFVLRAHVDQTHLEINRNRVVKIPLMAEVIEKKIEARKDIEKRMNALIAEAKANVRRSVQSDAIDTREFSVTENNAVLAGSVRSLEVGPIASEKSVKKPIKIDSGVPEIRYDWQALARLLWKVGARYDEWEKQRQRLEKWFIFSVGATQQSPKLLNPIQEALDRDVQEAADLAELEDTDEKGPSLKRRANLADAVEAREMVSEVLLMLAEEPEPDRRGPEI